MTSKCKNGGDSVGTFLQNIIKTEVFCYAQSEEISINLCEAYSYSIKLCFIA